MSAPADLLFDLDTLPPAAREAFVAIQAKVAGLEAQTERQDYLIAELRHALYGKRSEQLPRCHRQRLERIPETRRLRISDAQSGPNLCLQNRTVS